LDSASEGRRPSAPSSPSYQVPSLAIPAIRVVRKEEGRRSYSLPPASGDHVPAHRSPTPFQRRGCGLPLDLLGPRGAFTEPRRPSDVPVVTRRHARPASVPSDALSVTLHREVVGVHRDCPASRRTSLRLAGKGRAGESPRTSSVVSRTCEPRPTSQNQRVLFIVSALPRTVSPFLHSSPASGSASSFPPASALVSNPATKSYDSEMGKARDAFDRLLPPERISVYPYLVRSWLSPRLSSRGHRHLSEESLARFRSLGLHAAYQGTGRFHDARERFGGLQVDTRCLASAMPHPPFERTMDAGAWAFSSHGAHCNRASDTSVASPSFAGFRSAFALLELCSFELSLSHVRKPPRPS